MGGWNWNGGEFLVFGIFCDCCVVGFVLWVLNFVVEVKWCLVFFFLGFWIYCIVDFGGDESIYFKGDSRIGVVVWFLLVCVMGMVVKSDLLRVISEEYVIEVIVVRLDGFGLLLFVSVVSFSIFEVFVYWRMFLKVCLVFELCVVGMGNLFDLILVM